MIFLRKANERGVTQIDWLKSYHTFSFGEYYDERFKGFDTLRVINEDTVQPGKGFGTHAHQNMEIVSYVIEGALAHKDSLGTGSIIKPLEIQRMSAGSGVRHSEFNHSPKELVHFLQIWIIPNKMGLTPSYEQKTIQRTGENQYLQIASPEGGENAVTIHQAAFIFAGYFKKSYAIKHTFKGNKGWVQVIRGEIKINQISLASGDGAAIQEESSIEIQCISDAEFLLFDLE